MLASPDSRIGTELAGYRIEVLIGRGGMGVCTILGGQLSARLSSPIRYRARS